MAQISNWMHVYRAKKEKVRAGKAANDNSNTMSVNQNGSVKDGRDDFGNKVDREELITNSNIPMQVEIGYGGQELGPLSVLRRTRSDHFNRKKRTISQNSEYLSFIINSCENKA